jgi:hypothetical protein
MKQILSKGIYIYIFFLIILHNFLIIFYFYLRSSQFISPPIVWVTPDERDKWLRDLAGNAPLKVLAKSVPKG